VREGETESGWGGRKWAHADPNHSAIFLLSKNPSSSSQHLSANPLAFSWTISSLNPFASSSSLCFFVFVLAAEAGLARAGDEVWRPRIDEADELAVQVEVEG
jgi:hypothetical protein